MRPLLAAAVLSAAALANTLPGTQPLQEAGDLAAKTVAGIDRYLLRLLDETASKRPSRWNADYSSRSAYERSVEADRRRFRTIIGAASGRAPFEAPALDARIGRSAIVASGRGYTVYAVRWPVFADVEAEGLLIQPAAAAKARVVLVPDADWNPEDLIGLDTNAPPGARFALPFAAAGCQVLIPVLIDRKDTWSGTQRFGFTNQTHREFLYRMAYQVGEHIVGYEVQKVLAAIDWFSRQPDTQPIGVFGYGEGGLVALYAAASDTRINAAGVSGYFGKRDRIWQEPLYRNVWSLLEKFDDAGIARLIAPRTLVIEASRAPETEGPPTPDAARRATAAPGRLTTPSAVEVRAAADAVRPVYEKLGAGRNLQVSGDGTGVPGTAAAALLRALGATVTPHVAVPVRGAAVDARARMKRQFTALVEHTQHLIAESRFRRQEFWSKADTSSLEAWQRSKEWYRRYLWEEIIGKLPPASEPMIVRTRQSYDRPLWTGYDVVIPVWRDVFAYGVLLLPKDLKPGERRPVVVCQHGLEGTPQGSIDPEPRPDGSLRRPWLRELVERGFIVYAPQNPYRGEEAFRTLVRKANPLKLTLFSFILGQHEKTLDWLSSLPFVDPQRIAFYGISYGGKTAVRVPPLLDRYALSICSADFNEWIWKTARLDLSSSYLYTREYEISEFNLANTVNHGEMASLMAPRPFMVERGHHDPVSIDEWVAYEYAKVRRHYAILGIPEQTTIEFFNGPHTIHGEGTYEFLHKHLHWPEQRRPEGRK